MDVFCLSAFLLTLAGCKSRDFQGTESQVRDTADASAAQWLVNPDEMTEKGVFQRYRQVFMALGALEETKAAAAKLGVTAAGKRQQWAYFATVPLQCSRKSFLERDGIIWSNATSSYEAFAKVTMTMAASPACSAGPLPPTPGFPASFAVDPAVHREIVCLRAIGSALGNGGELRSNKPEAHMVDANPLSAREAAALRSIAAEGFLKPLDLIRNSRGELVPALSVPAEERNVPVEGTGIAYVDGVQLQQYLERWNADAMGLDRLSGDALVAAIARLSRQCISIHPFPDANGRTCRAWMARQFLVRGVPSPLMWSDEDILLTGEEWEARVKASVKVHESLLVTLR